MSGSKRVARSIAIGGTSLLLLSAGLPTQAQGTPIPERPATPIVAKGTSSAYNQFRGPNTTRRVVLSYDDCPRSVRDFRRTVLAAKQLRVSLVLFPTGQCVRSGKIDVTFARKHGMYVFNHSNNHPKLTRLSYRGITRELGTPGVQANYLRPPYGAQNKTVRRAAADKGMRIWLWTVDTNDWRGKSRTTVVRYVVRTARPGDTVLMHMQHKAFNPTAVEQMVTGLRKRGLEVCRNTGPTAQKPKVRC
ncbi:polysaccharide deacetylase family protein [Luteococcus sp. H138]|uniref:polysaccharide deacetylase family protein n=1 Tax=unclassified Luteococcus TaxID=2639923 RepID=UPI00313C5D32